jgi:hypothetical protein
MDEERERAEEYFRRAMACHRDEDKRTWLILAESYLLLSDFRKSAEAAGRMQSLLKRVEETADQDHRPRFQASARAGLR